MIEERLSLQETYVHRISWENAYAEKTESLRPADPASKKRRVSPRIGHYMYEADLISEDEKWFRYSRT